MTADRLVSELTTAELLEVAVRRMKFGPEAYEVSLHVTEFVVRKVEARSMAKQSLGRHALLERSEPGEAA